MKFLLYAAIALVAVVVLLMWTGAGRAPYHQTEVERAQCAYALASADSDTLAPKLCEGYQRNQNRPN